MPFKPIDHILFGAAYYDEYMPDDRLDRDIEMMLRAHINVVRIGESTWSTMEPQPGVFDFSSIDRVIKAMGEAGIDVIVGTPTYAVPTWLVKMYPDVLAQTHQGRQWYGHRQIMDISNPAYRFHAERAIRAMISHVAGKDAVIGYQLDNETKHYDVVSPDVQEMFVKWLRAEFNDDLDRLNADLGLDYWSNRINAWEDFPDIRGTINGSLDAMYQRFLRGMVADFLGWQADIVHEYARPDQFITQNFDLAWRGYSFGLQPQADDFLSSKKLDMAGIDIYHPSESALTGREIAFGGDLARSFKGGQNYLLLETQAQGQNGWLPYPGQLRLQGYSHLASGSDSIMYWHWHSEHNSFETYWKGLLSQDFEPNVTYEEAAGLGEELSVIGGKLVNLAKRNSVAIVVSNESLTALREFTIETGFPDPRQHEMQQEHQDYNDILRWVYDALFALNIECDFITPDIDRSTLERYTMVVAPALYSVDERFLSMLRTYVDGGGNLVATFKSFFADGKLKVWADRQPHGMTDVFGLTYNRFTLPDGVDLDWVKRNEPGARSGQASVSKASLFMELLQPDNSEDVLARYGHPAWKDFAAVTRHRYGHGRAWWIGTKLGEEELRRLFGVIAQEAGLWQWPQELGCGLTVRRGQNQDGHTIDYLLNYSGQDVTCQSPVTGTDLLGSIRGSGPRTVSSGDTITIKPWDLLILEE